ncbi:hypothetical protein FEMY_08220 [Ferrovum myxofaciens]|uniref:AsmA family protein n=1 Tax=Ferrovum myxofaciens TaxID=416213 RepID=A0A149W0G8_9PROT|nr:DUF748 domain-containing protein [Ferrovum myxofaciens]KXW58644.1 hypothetical protein FEMY_08220 [Ferrovum myxofaciens]
MRQLGWGLGILLGGLLVGLLTMPEWLPGVIHRQAQHWAEETHHRLEIGSLKVEIFPFRVQVHGVRLYEADGQTLVLGLEDLEASLAIHSGLRLLPVIDELTLTHPVVHLVRNPAGEWNLASLAGPSSGGGFPFVVEKVRILRGEGSVWDQGSDTHHDIRNLQFHLPQLFSRLRDKDSWLSPSLHAEVDGASLDLKARIRPFSSELRGEGDLSVQGLDLAPWIPSCSVSPGALTTHFAFWGPNWGALQRELSGLRLSVPQIKGRVAGLEILLQDVQLSAPSVRYDGGAVNFGVIHLMGHDGQIRPVGVSEAAFPSLPLSKLEGTVEKLAWPVSVRTPLPLSLTLQVGAQGRLQVAGPVDLRAQGAHLTVHAQHLDLRPVQPWLARYAQVRLESGQLSLEGVLDGSFSSPQVWQVRYRGQAQADELAVREGRRGQWLWRSKTLFAQGEATLNPLRLRLDQVALSDFYVRLHLLPDATLNWVNLLNPLPVSSPSPSVPKSAGSSPPESSSVVAQAAVVIRKVTLQGGTIHYRDDYVHPPYKANLTRLGGKIEGLSSAENTTARLELRGRVHDAPLLIEGQINPLAQNLFLDMTAQVTGMDLMQFSPYSGKYVGYDIERGKLSFDAHYSVRNHDLQATNHLVLNELTFGKPVASPGITHFPVALAVSLLQDPQGRIMVNLPIAGSLDDPQFSVGGVLARTLVQVLEKAVESIFVH